jgi:hypothetical protein
MTSSSLARPTPSFGKNDRENASAGFAMFIMMCVRGFGRSARLVRSTPMGNRPR